MVVNANFDSLLTTTLANYGKTIENNFATARPLVNFLMDRNRIRFVSGGQKIVEPLMYAKNTTAGSYSTYDTLATTAQDGISAAEFAWRQYAVTIALHGLEEAQNNGDAQIIDLLSAKIDQAQESLWENFDVMLLGDGTGNGGKDWMGLLGLVGATGVVGNIDSSVNAFWRSVATAAGAVRSDDTWTNVFNSASKGNVKPDFGITTQLLYEHYEASLAPALRLSSNKEADARFENLLFKGAPIYFDANIASGVTYFLNSKFINLVGHKDVWFKQTPFVKPSNQDARFAQILLYGNLTTNNRSRHAVVTTQTV